MLGAAALAAASAYSAETHAATGLDVALLVAVVALCAAGNLFEVFAPGHYSLQPNLPFFFAGALLLPPWAIAVAAAASYLPGWLVHRFRWYMVVFNVANYGLAGLAAYVLATAAGVPGGVDDLTAVAGLLAAAAAFVFINHALIDVVVPLAGGTPFGAALSRGLRLGETAGGAPIDFGLAGVGACIAALWITEPVSAVLAAAPMALLYAALWVPLLRHKSRVDPKTGLYNSQHFARLLDEAIEGARRRGGSVALVMLDLDHLRRVNNRHGHLAGDRLIAAVAELLGEAAGDTGVAGRFGGEEFAIILRATARAEAHVLAERLRKLVELRAIDVEAEAPVHVTVSIGVAAFPEVAAKEPAELVDAADKALYRAKDAGRNRVSD